jgi:hypothetical protein
MLKQKNTQAQKSFLERPIEFFNRINEPSFGSILGSSILGTLMTKFAGFRLLEEVISPSPTISTTKNRGTQIYYFGNQQIFWAPGLTHLACNKIEAVVNLCIELPAKENQCDIITKNSLVTTSEPSEGEPPIRQRIINFEFNLHNVSALDLLILKGDLVKIQDFLKNHHEKLKNLAITEQRIKTVSILDDDLTFKIFVFDVEAKKYTANLIPMRCLEPITTNISTLDLAILVREQKPEVHSLLVTELVLSLNTDPKVIEQFAVLLKTQQSAFDKFRSKSKAMEYLTDILALSIQRNGAIKVEMWIDNVRLAQHLPEADKEAFREYVLNKFVTDDVEKQLSPSGRLRKVF